MQNSLAHDVADDSLQSSDGNGDDVAVMLSVCIPTYCRRQKLIDTAFAVCSQMPAGTELVISDNGSTDGTGNAVRAFAATHKAMPIRLVTHDENIGFDRNLLHVVAAARGRYCWLLGDDDVPRPGAIARILEELNRNTGLAHMLLNYARRDAATSVINQDRMIAIDLDISPESPSDFFFLASPRPSYFRRLGTNVITMSANVVERRRWQEAAAGVERFIGYNMIHVFIIAAMLAAGGRSKFVAAPQVDYLCNNHRPWSNDVWNDYRTHVYGWLRELGYDPFRLTTVEAEGVAYRTWRGFARAVRDRMLRKRRGKGA